MKQLSMYIGDGVYASYDGYQICLATDRGKGLEKIYLEPAVLISLLNFAMQVGMIERGDEE